MKFNAAQSSNLDRQLAGLKPMSVGAYFKTAFDGTNSSDPTLTNLPMNTKCGQDCVDAINVALKFITHVKMAGPDNKREIIEDIMTTCDEICQIYWKG